jgi:sugar phosphate isomerase/epimerase
MPALDAMRHLRPLGYRLFDIIATPGHLWPGESDRPARSALRAAAEADDIVIESINPQPVDLNLSSALREVREFSISIYADVIRLAVDLGAVSVVVVPGRVSALASPPRRDSLARAADSIAALNSIARSEGLGSLLIENHPTTGLASASDMLELINAIGAEDVLVAYDVANAEAIGENQVEALRQLGTLVGQTHLSDARYAHVAHDPIGTGSVRFEEILAVLYSQGSTATNVIEIVSDDPVADFAAAARWFDSSVP